MLSASASAQIRRVGDEDALIGPQRRAPSAEMGPQDWCE
jgi:hypothetical protein